MCCCRCCCYCCYCCCWCCCWSCWWCCCCLPCADADAMPWTGNWPTGSMTSKAVVELRAVSTCSSQRGVNVLASLSPGAKIAGPPVEICAGICAREARATRRAPLLVNCAKWGVQRSLSLVCEENCTVRSNHTPILNSTCNLHPSPQPPASSQTLRTVTWLTQKRTHLVVL